MPARHRSHWPLRALSALTILSACNALLDNDPRSLEASGGESGQAGGGARGGFDAGGNFAGAGATSDAGGGARHEGAGEGGGAGVPNCDAGSAGEAGACGSKPSACLPGATACMPGEIGMQTMPCGACMTGTVTQTRTCTASCSWGEWVGGGQCTGVTAACTPAMSESRSVACPCSGTQTQSRTCSSACSWGGWSDTSSCNLECCTELVYCDTPNDVATNRGTWCRRRDADCSQSQVDSDCSAAANEVCGGVVAPLYTEY